MLSLSPDQLEQLADALRDTCSTIEATMERLGFPMVDVDEVENELIDYDCERCSECGWWFATTDLTRYDDWDPQGTTDGMCDSCAQEQRKANPEDYLDLDDDE